MNPGRTRFDPPPVAIDAPLRWVLGRAFGPAVLQFEELEGEGCAELAAALGLAPRIASRQALDRLTAEIGSTGAAEIRRQRGLAAAHGMRLQEAFTAFDEIAADLRVPYAPLKGQALRLGGFAADHARPSADIDLLVPERRLADLQAALLARGFRRAGEGYEHQAPALRHAGGGSIELHRLVLGVRPNGRESATFEELAALQLAGLPATATGLGEMRPRGDLRLPRRELLTAHALVHALAQHAFAPRAYPALLLIADLQDLGFQGSAGRGTLASIQPWIERAVPFEDAQAALDLTTALAGGDASLFAAGPRLPRRELLDHLLAGALDARYSESLKTRTLEDPLSDRSRYVARAATVAGALLPARQRRPDGAAESAVGYLGRLLRRPFDLVRRWRSARAAASR